VHFQFSVLSVAKKPCFKIGEPIDPDDLWFRDEFIDLIWETIRNRHVLITAPRRTGKTSVMNHLAERPRDGFLVVSQNVQDLKHPSQLFETILENVFENHRSTADRLIRGGWKLLGESTRWLKENVDSVGAGSIKIALRRTDPNWRSNWKQHADETLRQLRGINKPVLLIIDELPDLILNMRGTHDDELKEFLGWFRRVRQQPSPSKDSIRWLIGGSVNLASTLDEIGEVDLINDIAMEPLPILTDDQVKDFVVRMLTAYGVEFSQTVPNRIVFHLGRPIPYFMQLLTQAVQRSYSRQQRKITAKDVDKIFDEMVTSQDAQSKLKHYHSRIERYYRSPRQSAAYLLLSKLSQSSKKGISRRAMEQVFQKELVDLAIQLDASKQREQFNHLMRDLENDFYVCECQSDCFDFSSGVIKAWWRKYYG
jgi:hypothetical protein